ncbi:MAG: hypothetical protein U0X20_27625 [Caldilineaceae bacterium]
MTPIQRFAAWLAAVTLVPPGRAKDGFEPIAYPQGVADKGWGELHQEMDDAREAWRQNPLARRLVGIVTAYVVGNGIALRSEYALLQRFIDDFWQMNQLDQRIPEWCDELCRSGEIFPVLFTNPADRRSTVRCVPASIIERIEWREGDYEAELRFKEVASFAGLGLIGEEAERWWVSPLHPAAGDLATPVMLHYAVNRPVGALRGESDLAPILPWLKRYSRWLEDRVRLNAGVRAFLWVVKAPARLRTELAERYRQPPEPGSLVIADEQESWSAVAPNLNANDAAADGRAIRWMIVAGGPGTSLLDLGEGEDSNLATGQVMTEMRRRFLRRRQAYLAWLLSDLVLVAWRRYAVGNRVGRRTVTAADIAAIVPDISVEDNQKLAQAAMQLASGLGSVAQLVGSGQAYKRMALRMFVKFAGEQISERELEQILKDGLEGVTDGQSEAPDGGRPGGTGSGGESAGRDPGGAGRAVGE